MKVRKISVMVLTILFIFSGILNAGVFDKYEYEARRMKLMKSISDGIAIILGAEEAQPYTKFLQNNDFMYFTGVEAPGAILIIDGMKKEAILFLAPQTNPREYPKIQQGKEAVEETGIEKIYSTERFTQILASYQAQTNVIYTPFQPQEKITNCGRENISYFMNRFLDPWDGRVSREKNFIGLIRERFPSFMFRDLSPFIANLRLIKSPAEIELMREAGRISSLAHIEMLRAAKPGMYEWELAAIFEFFLKKQGCIGFAYSPIVASGPSMFYSHYFENVRKIEDGDMVLVDMGGDYHYYDIDISLAFPINGKFTERQERLNRIVYEVHKAMLEVFRPGIRSIDMRDEVKKIVKQKGFDIDEENVQRIWADHWIGLAVHDDGPSSRTTVLKPGMVLAEDPSIRIPEETTGNKIENTVVITEDGCENLTYLVPRTVDEIEKVMAEKGILEVLEDSRR